jgi:PAS domain S-box-containing protein
MTLRARVLVWGALLYIGFIAILGVLGAWFLQKSHLAIEATEVRAETEATARIFQQEVASLALTTEDWGAWDDADLFIRRPNPDFIRANLGIPSLTAIKVDFIAFIETGTSRIVEARALDWRRGVAETFPVSMTDHLGAKHPLIASSESGTVVSGLLALPEGVLFVAAAPIRPSDRRGPISGTLVMGRFIRENAVDDLKRLSGHEVALTPPGERLAEGIHVLPLDDRRISGEKALVDLHGEPVLSLRIVLPRVIYLQGRRSSFQLLTSLIVAGLAAFAAILFMLDRYVLRRLQDLSDQVAHVDLDARCFAIRIKGADEISVLARNINRLLATVDLNRAAFKESETRHRRIVETASEGIMMLGASLRIAYANRRLTEMLGRPLVELLGRPFTDFMPPEEIPDHERRHGKRIEGAAGDRYERRLRRTDGELIWGLVSTTPIIGPEGQFQGTFAMVADITEQKRLQAKLVETEKRESISLLAGGVAHDFNNILTAIGGSVDELRHRLTGLAERECVDDIASAAGRAADLTRQLLALGRHQVLAPVDLDINRELGRFKRILRRIIRGDIVIKLQLEKRPVLARMDPGQLERVLLNLAINAQEAMPKGGTLILETAAASRETSPPAPDQARREIRLSVRDSGLGMTPEVRARIFAPCFTTRADGAGLGLSSVLGIVEQSGGRIEVESEVGRGAVFHIYLPEGETSGETTLPSRKARPVAASPSVDASRATTPAETSTASAAGAVILVADDREAILKVTRRALERRGYLVLTAPDGLAAARLAEGLDRLDLLLTDVMMPGLDGFETAARIHVTRPDLPVLFMSGYVEELSEAKNLLNAENFLAKPFSVDDLLARVAALLAGETGDKP